MINPVGYFEIPVLDMERAVSFYSTVFDYHFTPAVVDGHEMALFPHLEGKEGITGALAKGDAYIPSKNGSLIYFNTDNIKDSLKRVVQAGGAVLYGRKSIGELGFVAEFEDSEGNRIALHQAA
ncbi:VOC family protein [Kordiimonas sp. SCSIO 12603]|uniref:VOC family protein n=1 Tax=Kordiimonas sp. SCSIO 12603 TaxID=2829596 RepID=UPI002102E38D|nr:VOC family protein [Kordiimonas sp. SCSIO 12603]UTW57396.1 VOC family protein [Kordiimonas sp. SCSIO 12603]